MAIVQVAMPLLVENRQEEARMDENISLCIEQITETCIIGTSFPPSI